MTPFDRIFYSILMDSFTSKINSIVKLVCSGPVIAAAPVSMPELSTIAHLFSTVKWLSAHNFNSFLKSIQFNLNKTRKILNSFTFSISLNCQSVDSLLSFLPYIFLLFLLSLHFLLLFDIKLVCFAFLLIDNCIQSIKVILVIFHYPYTSLIVFNLPIIDKKCPHF